MTTRDASIPRSLSYFIASSNAVSSILERLGRLHALQCAVRAHLGAPDNEHFIVADYSRKTLVLHSDSAAWATKLRLRLPEILAGARECRPEVRSIRIKIAPAADRARRP